MITPLTITSLSQGILGTQYRSRDPDSETRVDEPQPEDLPFWHAMKIEWPRWSLRRRADRT